MYYNCHFKIAACCIFGILGIVCTIIQFIIISCLLFAIYNLIFKRISIEPMHHPYGGYHWALTKNGKTIKWFGKTHRNPKVKEYSRSKNSF